jgi:integrase
MSAGHIRPRGKGSWELKFDAGRDPATGRRMTRYKTVRGTKKDAQRELRYLLGTIDDGSNVEASKITVAEHVRARVEQWAAAYDPTAKKGISPKTAERYRELVENQLVPHIGQKLAQKLTPADIEQWHATLSVSGRKGGKGGVSARTIGHAHRILVHALRDGQKHGLLPRNVASIEGAPKVNETEVQVVPKERIGELIDKLRGRAMYARAITSLFTRLRRGEVLALRWHHIDLDNKVLQVREALEETKTGVRVRQPKTGAGRRDVSLPEIVVEALREHRRQQLELRMALGAGKIPDDALVFPAPLKGGYQSPRAFSKEWARLAVSIGFKGITFHALRHTHVSQLHDAGVDIVTISKTARPPIGRRHTPDLLTHVCQRRHQGGGCHQRGLEAPRGVMISGGNWVATFAFVLILFSLPRG